MPCGESKEFVINLAFTVAPEVVYSAIVLVPGFSTNRFDPETAIGPAGTPVNRVAFTVAPEVVYSPIVSFKPVTNRFDPDTATLTGRTNPVISAGLTAVPEVEYSPIKLLSRSTTKSVSLRLVAGMVKVAINADKIAAAAHRPVARTNLPRTARVGAAPLPMAFIPRTRRRGQMARALPPSPPVR